ncbi:MAG: hypothetical protein AB8G05_22280 [Oligoflexales bacterium]
MMTRKSTRNMFLGLVSIAAVACGGKKGSNDATDASSTEIASSDTELVRVQINISDTNSSLNLTNGGSLSLTADADDFSLDIDTCATGYTNTGITSASAPVDVYKGDIGCLAKLKSLTLGASVYTPSTDFTTWQAGDTAVFTDGSNSLALSVQSTLSDPISGTEAISIAFTEIDSGTDVLVAENALGDSHNISVSGEASPAFQVTDVTLNSVTAGGAGDFAFEVTCENAVVGTGAAATCDAQLVTDMTYVLLNDTYGGSMTIAEAQTAIAGGTAVVAGDVVAFGGTNGGFDIASAQGPNAMHTNPNMILLIGINGTSFRYINIDLDTLE